MKIPVFDSEDFNFLSPFLGEVKVLPSMNLMAVTHIDEVLDDLFHSSVEV
jgi:hypothetical protein